MIDKDDWGLSQALFDHIVSVFGILPTVDWFASDYNAKLPRFYSRFWNPHSEGIDALSECWTFEFGYFFPPIGILHKVLEKLKSDKAEGILVVPRWPSALFWPMICPKGFFIEQVKSCIVLPRDKAFYTKCQNGKGIFGNVDLEFDMLALLVKF